MVPFANFEMPVKYGATTIKQEHQAVRQRAGLFDVSHMGEVLIEGPDASPFVQYLLANNTSKLVDYQAQYNPILNEKGGVIDDVILYKFSKERYMIVMNASNVEKDLKHIHHLAQQQQSPESLSITDISDQVCLLALQGPKAFDVMKQLYPEYDLREELKYYHFRALPMTQDHPIPTLISRTGYTGEEGVEIYIHPDQVVETWNRILEYDEVSPAGLGARDILRLEAGFCLYGHELTDDIYPHEAGIGWAVKMKAGKFHGRPALRKAREAGFTRKLVPFIMNQPRTIPRDGYSVLTGSIKESRASLGYVTSGTQSPILERGIGLALINNNKDITKPGTEIGIKIRNKIQPATITKLPIHKQPLPI